MVRALYCFRDQCCFKRGPFHNRRPHTSRDSRRGRAWRLPLRLLCLDKRRHHGAPLYATQFVKCPVRQSPSWRLPLQTLVRNHRGHRSGISEAFLTINAPGEQAASNQGQHIELGGTQLGRSTESNLREDSTCRGQRYNLTLPALCLPQGPRTRSVMVMLCGPYGHMQAMVPQGVSVLRVHWVRGLHACSGFECRFSRNLAADSFVTHSLQSFSVKLALLP